MSAVSLATGVSAGQQTYDSGVGGSVRLCSVERMMRSSRKRERGRDSLGPVGQIPFEVGVAEAHLCFIGLALPQPGARRLVDDRLRDAELACASVRTWLFSRWPIGSTSTPPSPCFVK